MKLSKSALSGIAIAVVLLVLVVLLLNFPYRASPNDPPIWVALVIAFAVSFPLFYLKARFQSKKERN